MAQPAVRLATSSQAPISFEENRGQASPAVKFVAKSKAYTVLFTPDETIFAPHSTRGRVLRMRLEGAGQPSVWGAGALPGKVYYVRPEASGKLAPAATFRRIKYSNIYRGVDLDYYGNDDQLEFDFTVAPQQNPGQIRLLFDGADRVAVGELGELRVVAGGSEIRLKRPVVYQERNGVRREVAGRYVVSSRRGRAVRFAIGAYDPSLPLVIDPTILYATYSGGPGNESIVSTEVNKSGEIYLFGSTTALPSGGAGGLSSPLRVVSGTTDPLYTPLYCFVEKLSADASRMLFRVYFQGFRECEAFTVAPSGAIHLAMRAPYSFNGFAQLRTLTGDDGSGNASALSISNLNGGSFGSIPGRPFGVRDIKADSSDNVYLLYQQLVQGDAALQSRVLKVNATGDVVDTPFDVGLYSSGVGFGDTAVAMAIDEFGQVFVTGNTNGGFPTTPDAFQQPRTMFQCPQDAFLMRVDTAQSPWTTPYASVLGGESCESVLGIVRDPLGFIYLTGRTFSSDFPMAGIAFQDAPNLSHGVGDGFIVKFDLNQAPPDQLVAGTFLGLDLYGGSDGIREAGHPLVVLPGGELAVTGAGASLTPLNQLFNATQSNTTFQQFVQVFTADGGALLLGTNLDNTGQAAYSLIAGDGTRAIYAVTETAESNRATPGVAQEAFGGGTDLLVSKIDLSDIITNVPPVVDLGPDRTVFTTSNTLQFDLATAPVSVYDFDGFVASHTWRIDGGAPMVFSPPSPVAGVSLALGRHVLTLAVTDNGGATTSDTAIIDVAQGGANGEPTVDAGPDVTAVATSPAGATVVVRGQVSDPDGDTLAVTWSGPFGAVPFDVGPPYFSGNAALFLQFPIGSSQATLTADDHNGHIVSSTVNVTVNGSNTGAGSAIDLTVLDDRVTTIYGFTPGRIKLHFDSISAAGLTQLRTRTDQVPPPPAGKQLGSAPYYYDVATSATGSGNVRLCIDATGMSFVDPSQARLHRLNGTTWNDIGVAPTSAESAGHLICGVIPFFQAGTFALFTPADESTRVTTMAGTGAPYGPGAVVAIDPAPTPATSVPLVFPEGMAFDAVHQFLYVSDSYRVRRIDLQTNLMRTIAGNGTADFAGRRYNVDALQTAVFTFGQLAIDHAGNVFIADANGCGILRLEPQNNFNSYFLTRVAGKGPDPATLECGYAGDGGRADIADVNVDGRLVFDTAGNLFFTQNGFASGQVIRRIAPGADGLVTGNDPDEIITTVAGGGTVWPPTGNPRGINFGGSLADMTFSPRGDMYLALGGLVARFSPAPGATLIDGSGGESISPVAGGGIIPFAPFQGDGGSAISAEWFTAWSVAVLPGGDLIVADQSFSRLRRITAGADGVVNGGADEIISTVAGFSDNTTSPPFNGDGYALSTAFNTPRKVVVDPRGGIDIADSGFNRIRHIGFGAGTVADLSVTMTASSEQVAANQTVTYHVTVTNNGPATATGVGVSMPVAAGLTQSAISPAGFCVVPIGFPIPVGGTIFCDGGNLFSGQSVEITIALRPNSVGSLASAVTASANQTDPNPANNTAQVSVDVVGGVDLAVAIVAPANGAVVSAGAPVTFDVTVSNGGQASSHASRLRLALPTGLQFVSGSLAGVGCDASGSAVMICDLDGIPAGALYHATIVLTPVLLGPFTAGFDLSTIDDDTNPANNAASVTLTSKFTYIETVRVRDEIPLTARGTAAQAALEIADTVRVHDTVLADGNGGAGPGRVDLNLTGAITVRDRLPLNASGVGHADLDVTDAIHVRDQLPLSGGHVAGAQVAVTETVHVTDTPDIPGMTYTLVTSGGVEYRALDDHGADHGIVAQFTAVPVPGILTANLMAAPPQAPAGFRFVGGVYDVVVVNGTVTPPITVCFTGTGFTPASRVLHYETITGVRQWVDRTTLQTPTRVCATVDSLSPFVVAEVVNQTPAASAGVYPPFEATSPAGAAVTLAGAASDPDPGDVLTVRWREGSTTLGSAAVVTTTLAIGSHDLTFTVTDSHGATAVATTRVIVRDTKPPVVTSPAALSIPATDAMGTRVAAWPALSAWLSTATAIDGADPAPAVQSPQVNGAPVNATTLFPIGSTTVTFRFVDASGNSGLAKSTVQVSVGTPRIKLALVGSGTSKGSDKFVDLSVTNQGTGIANHVTMFVAALTVKGTGLPTVRTPMPVSAGDLNPGDSRTVRVIISVPPSAKELAIIEAGAFLNVKGQPGAFADLQSYKP